MKKRIVFIPIFTALLLIVSCTKILTDPVESCNFDGPIDNASNPYSELYQKILDEYVAMGLPGVSVAIETPDFGWWIGCSGIARIEDGTIMQPCHLHQSASMAKPYIATMVMRLIEDEKLGLDDPIRNYLPDDMVSQIANADEATIRQLLSHRSGIFDTDENLKYYVDAFNDPKIPNTATEVFEKYLYGMPAYGDPGESYNYSNAGYNLLGMIIEEASGMGLGEYFEQEIRQPLRLNHTYYRSDPGYPENIPNRVNGYWERLPGQLQNCTDISNRFCKNSMGSEGIFSTPYEYARFLQELMRGNIVDSTTLLIMIAEENKSERMSNDYFLGIMHWSGDDWESYGHTGTSVGTMGVTMYFPADDVTFALTTNLGGTFTSVNTRRFRPDLLNELLNVTFTGKRGTGINERPK